MTSEGSSSESAGAGDEPAGVDERRLVVICVLAAVAGVLVGFLGGVFRWCLEGAQGGLDDLLDWAHDLPGPGWLVPILVTGVAAGLARLIVVWAPQAAGSGIQDVEAVWKVQDKLPPLHLIPAKFIGGVLALGSGLVLGREGPTVQMGAVIGAESGRRLDLADADRRLLHVALAGAGLGVAFNAPVGGALFSIEEVTKSFRLRAVLTTLVASAVAVGCARIVVGNEPDFLVSDVAPPKVGQLGWYIAFGLLTGLLGALYNVVVVRALRITDRVGRVGPIERAAVIGAFIGLLLWIDPLLAGGGDRLSQRVIDEPLVWTSLLGFLAVRFVAGPISYAAGTPGGLFAPLLALGALWGALVHGALEGWAPGVDPDAVPFVIVGMAALFAAVVRAPLTGLVLIIEMTGAAALSIALLAGCFGAVLAAEVIKSPPIYDSLRARMLSNAAPSDPQDGA